MFLSFIRYLFLALNHSRRLLSGSLCHVIISHLPQHLPHHCSPSDLYLINHPGPGSVHLDNRGLSINYVKSAITSKSQFNRLQKITLRLKGTRVIRENYVL